MKTRYITTALLAAGLMTGCINVKVYNDDKPKPHEGKESECREEEKEDHDSKGKHHEGKESKDRDEEKGEHESKGKHHEGKKPKDHDEEKDSHDSKAKLKAAAKISERDARQTALARVPNGKIKEGELEMENGKLQWSFDMVTPDSKDITEVNINAITGEIISVDKEAPEGPAKEQDEHGKKEKEEKEKD